MYWFIGEGVKNSIDMVEDTAVHTIEFTCLESCHSSSGDVIFNGDGCWVTANSGPLCSKDFSSGVSSSLERLITHLSWILEEVEEVKAVFKVLVVFEAILEVILEDLEMRCSSFLIWVFLYCRNVFSLLLKIMFCRSVKLVHIISVLLHLVFQHKRQLKLHTFLISIYNRSVIPMFTRFKLQDN